MDILAHGLWSGAAAKGVNRKYRHHHLSVKWAVFWGIFPDLFAFALPLLWFAWDLIFGRVHLADLPRPEQVEPVPTDARLIFQVASALYTLSHSVFVFFLVFGIVFILARRPALELFGWLLHILIDIPTHSYRFYPTPFLWPISSWKFNGLSWATSWFLATNYTALAVVYWLLYKKSKP